MKKIKKYKYIILINIFVFISYLSILRVLKLFGIDDISANQYIFCKTCTLSDKVQNIYYRIVYWNNRFGELLYFTIGCFPRWIFYLFSGLCVILFFNLIYIYIFGKKYKTYLFTSKYIITILISFLLTLTLCPCFSETFIWMGGIFNHLFDITIIMICGLPFRLKYDNTNILNNQKKSNIFFYIISFIAGFTIESITPCLIIYELFILYYIKIKNKLSFKKVIQKNSLYFISIIITSISYIIMLLSSKNRLNYFIKENNISIFNNSNKLFMFNNILKVYKYYIIVTVILLIVVIIKKKSIKKVLLDSKLYIFQIILSIVSLLIIKYSMATYSTRTTFILYLCLTTYDIYLVNILIENKRIEKCIIIVTILLIAFFTINKIFYYKDYNEFNKIRKEFIIAQYKKGNKIIICPIYDNKNNYITNDHLSSFEYIYCESTHIEYILKDKNIELINKKINIR